MADSPGAVGYGSIYHARIEDVIKGTAPDSKIAMTILAGEQQLESLFAEALGESHTIEVGFHEHGTDAKHSLMPINGFVDSNRTSWTIQYVEPPAGHEGYNKQRKER